MESHCRDVFCEDYDGDEDNFVCCVFERGFGYMMNEL
jgi:hypothetical protein